MASPIGPLPPSRGARVQLVVAEKPSVARDLAQSLGIDRRLGLAFVGERRWIVPCVGHMAELAPPEHYTGRWRAWRLDTLPMLPDAFALVAARRNEDHWHALKAWLCHPRVAELVNACDAGREGELIFRYVTELAACRLPVRRLWLQALTGPAVRRAFERLQPSAQFDGLADAARCRAEADWLVGLNGTRALTVKGRPHGGGGPLYSVGRVQTPTLAMLIEREEAIERFCAQPYWEVHAEAPEAPGATFRVVVPKERRLGAEPAADGRPAPPPPPAPAAHRFAALADARAAAQAVANARGQVREFSAKEETLWPPALFDLTALQREANVRFGLKAADCLAAAQTLYESEKAITYPRTDSRYLPSALADGLEALVLRLLGGPLATVAQAAHAHIDARGRARVIRDEAVTDHHALVPTGQLPRSGPDSAAGKVYALIVRRFLAAMSPPARAGLSELWIEARGISLLARGRSLVVPGWQAVEPPARQEAGTATLPALARGAEMALGAAKVVAEQTRPPPRLTEATLLAAMERAGGGRQAGRATAGLGTPATRASIIETLKGRGYVRAEGRALVPTPAGRALCAALPTAALKSAELTSLWEARLAAVAAGREARAAFMRDIGAFVHEMVASIRGAQSPGPASAAGRPARARRPRGERAAPGAPTH